MAYYGVIYNDVTVMQDAYDQCRLYRQYLRDPTTGLWKHIVLGNFQDYGYWGTGTSLSPPPLHLSLTSMIVGNAWAAAGMTRVIATLQNSQYAGQFSNQINDLASWVNEILTATFSHVGVRPIPLLIPPILMRWRTDERPVTELLHPFVQLHLLLRRFFLSPSRRNSISHLYPRTRLYSLPRLDGGCYPTSDLPRSEY